MTATTAPAFTHSQLCTDASVGRAVRALFERALLDPPVGPVTELMVLDYAITAGQIEQNNHCCDDCAKRALTRVENELRLARKRQRAFNADAGLFNAATVEQITAERAADVDHLIAKRDAIRKAIG